ncbi:hypothetical protein OTK49_02955 [Vibrio coralliirubri]|uniref:hypothetical protein n=1 Tax=Vibrio coralliirubri TaxID=1516159 RepID=UPI00228439CD|nr:hypothetical protein [Vibrio coralliirubri]MCY9861474.1 hypothetical protein [Vibrio coralliirubri]
MELSIEQVKSAVSHLSERGGGFHQSHILTLMVLGINAAAEMLRKEDGSEVDVKSLIEKLPFGLLFKWNPVSESPLQTYGWSSQDVLVCTPYNLFIGRTRGGEWIDMGNKPIENVLFWSDIPIPTQLQHESEEYTQGLGN